MSSDNYRNMFKWPCLRVAQNLHNVINKLFPPFLWLFGPIRWLLSKRLSNFNENLAGSSHLKYTKEILKYTKNFFGNRIFHFWPWKQLFRISNMVGCIPEVLTLLLTPILTLLHMVYVRAPCMSYMTYITSDKCKSHHFIQQKLHPSTKMHFWHCHPIILVW